MDISGILWFRISLITDDIEHLLSFHCISFLEQCPFKPFAHVLIGLFVFLLNCKSSLCILDIKLSLVIQLTNNFARSVGCFFIVLIMSFDVQKILILMTSSLSIFSFVTIAFGIKSWNLLPSPRSWKSYTCVLYL